ncbi:MAG: dockerin type I domain-containing protein [Candidatus Zixiibacteriota bacterium]
MLASPLTARCGLPRLLLLLAIRTVLSFNACDAQIDLSTTGSFLWSANTAIESDSTHVLVGSADGLRVYRREGPAEFTLQAQIEIDGGVRDIAIADSVAFLADGHGDLLALAHRSSVSQTIPLELVTGTGVRFVETVNRRLIVVGDSVAQSFDISFPWNPFLSSTIGFTGPPVGLSGADSVVLIPCGSLGLVVLTIDDAGILHHAADFRPSASGSPVPITEAATNGRHAWVPNAAPGVLTINLTDPTSPFVQGRILTFGNARHVALDGDRLLIADAVVGLASCKVTATGASLWQSENSGLRDIKLIASQSPSRFYSTNGGTIVVLDIDFLGDVSPSGEFGFSGGYNSIAHHGPWVFIPDNRGFWRVHADSVESDTSFLRFGNKKIHHALVCENDLFTASGADGVRIYRVFGEGTPVLLGTMPARDPATGIVVDRDTAIVLEGGAGYRLFDISVRSQPRLIGQDRKSTAFPTGVLPSTRYMYLAEGAGLLTVYDLEFPIKPERVRVVPLASQVRQLQVKNHRLYVADRAAGYLTFDIKNESNPILISDPVVPASLTAFRQSGRVLYTGDTGGRVTAFDMTDPAHPEPIDSVELDAEILAIDKYRERLLIVTPSAFHMLEAGPPLVAGDFDASGETDAGDLVALVDFLLRYGPSPWRPNSADVNADGRYNLQDVVVMVDFLYGNGEPLQTGAVE